MHYKSLIHIKVGVLFHLLTLELKLNNGNSFMHLHIEIYIFRIVLVLGVAERKTFTRIICIGLKGKSCKRKHIYTVSVFQDIEIAVFCGDPKKVCHTTGLSGCRTHPQSIMVSPLYINGMMIHESLHNIVWSRSPVKNVSDYMQMIDNKSSGKVAKCNYKILSSAGLDYGVHDLGIVCLEI